MQFYLRRLLIFNFISFYDLQKLSCAIWYQHTYIVRVICVGPMFTLCRYAPAVNGIALTLLGDGESVRVHRRH